MALEHLFTDRIEENTEFAVHPEASYFSVRDGKIRQFRVNPSPNKNMIEIPGGANTFVFQGFFRHGWKEEQRHIEYGRVVFYNFKGEVLKIYDL